MKNAAPTVSIVIPAYNHARFLRDSVESAIGQTYPDLEVVIIDNCSTDDTRSLALSYESKDGRVRYVRNDTNIGMVRNFNKALAVASGTYIKLLCADDVLERGCIEMSLEEFAKNPAVSLVSCARRLVSENLAPVGTLAYSNRRELVPGRQAIARCLFHGNLIGEPSAVMVRKEDVGTGFSDGYRQLVDLEMWFRILEKGDFAFIPETLCRIREHGRRATFKNMLSLAAARDEIRIYRDYGHKDYIDISFLKRQELILRRLSFCVVPPLMALVGKVVPIRR